MKEEGNIKSIKIIGKDGIAKVEYGNKQKIVLDIKGYLEEEPETLKKKVLLERNTALKEQPELLENLLQSYSKADPVIMAILSEHVENFEEYIKSIYYDYPKTKINVTYNLKNMNRTILDEKQERRLRDNAERARQVSLEKVNEEKARQKSIEKEKSILQKISRKLKGSLREKEDSIEKSNMTDNRIQDEMKLFRQRNKVEGNLQFKNISTESNLSKSNDRDKEKDD